MLGQTCIWCGESTEDSDVSHVMPECFGNEDQQCLDPGVVCKKCNNYFGAKVEPALSADPLMHAICVATRIVDPGDSNVFRDRMFEPHKTAEPVARGLKLNAKYGTDHFITEIDYSISGKIRLNYDYRRESIFSRVLHKIAFENYVWHLAGNRLSEGAPDPFDPRFAPIKQWARFGQPHRQIRPYIRMPATRLEFGWEFFIIELDGEFRTEMRLYGDCFAVALTTSPDQTLGHLRRSCARTVNNAVLVHDKYELIKAHA